MSFLNANPLSLGAPGVGLSTFGFEVPQGDPGAIEAAGRAARRLAFGFSDQARTLRAGAQIAGAADGNWTGSAATSFAGLTGRIDGILGANAHACESAAGTLGRLAQALSHAQFVTRQALSDCEHAHTEMQTQQGLADGYGQNAASAAANLAASPHPAMAAQYQHQLDAFQGLQRTAQGKADAASGDLARAQTRGRDAAEAYAREAAALAASLSGAAGDLRPVPAVPGGAAPVPITATARDIAIATGIARQIAADKLSGPAIAAIPPSERTPGVIAALLNQERQAVDTAMSQGGARGPYGAWTNDNFLNPATVNAMVAQGLLPPRPANWESMTPRQQYAYLQALGPYFSGLGCAKGGVCSFVSATGTGTNSIPQVLHTLSRWGEYAAIGVCVAGSDGTCIGAVKVAFLGDTASNLANATSPGDFAAHEGLSAAETVVAGGGGIIAASLGKAGALETVLPSSTLGQTMLKVHFTLPSAVTTVIAPRIDERVFPAPPPHHGHLGH